MISMDKKYRTRDGRDVRLLCVDGPEDYPVIGIVAGDKRAECWTSGGLSYDDGCGISETDLIEYHEPDIRTIWVNVYEGGVSAHGREDLARFSAGEDTISIAQPVTFEVKK